jgi:superoxide oxidase
MQMNAPQRFNKVTIALHWLTGGGIIAVSIIEQLRQQLPQGPLRAGLWKGVHMPAGTVIFALVLISIVWRLFHPSPTLPVQMRPWEQLAANLTKIALYAAMISIPLLGIVFSFARDKPIDFGLYQLAYPLKYLIADETMKQMRAVHEFLGQAVLVLAFAHAAAALWHHYVRKDDVLSRMLPQKAAPSAHSIVVCTNCRLHNVRVRS